MSEALARLTAKTISLDGGFGGKAELTMAEFAGVLKGLDPIAKNYGYAKYLENYTLPKRKGQPKYEYMSNTTFARLWYSVSAVAAKLVGGEDLAAQIAYAVCVEAIEPDTCKTCDGNGRKFSRKDKKYNDCQVCFGVGRKGKTDHARAQLMGRDRKIYYKYEQPYDAMLTLLYSCDEKIRRKIHKEFS